MALPPDRSSRSLHNFKLPPLRWGNQRHLRCMKINNTQQPNSFSQTPPPPPTVKFHHRSSSVPKSPVNVADDDDDDEGIEAVRQKVMSDLRVAADRMKNSILEDNSGAAAGPCNLRTRRAACKEPPLNVVESPRRVNGGGNSANNKPPPPPPPQPESPVVVTRLRGLAAAANSARQSLERGEPSHVIPRPKFSTSLTRDEIESDFLLMTGKKPPRRPKKRSKAVQRQVDTCFPGLWLSEVTADTYKVQPPPDSGKS